MLALFGAEWYYLFIGNVTDTVTGNDNDIKLSIFQRKGEDYEKEIDQRTFMYGNDGGNVHRMRFC